MIKNIKFLFAGVCVFLAASINAQDYAFKVLVNKGKNEIKEGDNWQLIKVGSGLKSGDEVKIAENSYLGLVHATGKPLEVKQSGKYKVTDLAAKVDNGSSVLNKYTDFILSSNTKKKNNLSATGAVHRGADNIKVYLPSAELAVTYNNNIIIQWETMNTPAPYIVKFNSMFGDELDKIETNENSITIDLSNAKFANEDNILVQVVSKANQSKKSEEYTLKRLSQKDRERIKTSLNDIAAQTAEQTALNKLVLAGFYEQNNLIIDASTAYQEAIKLAPDVPAYQESYKEFLIRNGIKQK